MLDLKTILSPFRVERQPPVTPAEKPAAKPISTSAAQLPASITESRDVRGLSRRQHPTACYEFDSNFKIGSTSYTNRDHGSVSIRTSRFLSQDAAFACFLDRESVDRVIDALEEAKEIAFPIGGRTHDGSRQL